MADLDHGQLLSGHGTNRDIGGTCPGTSNGTSVGNRAKPYPTNVPVSSPVPATDILAPEDPAEIAATARRFVAADLAAQCRIAMDVTAAAQQRAPDDAYLAARMAVLADWEGRLLKAAGREGLPVYQPTAERAA